MSRPEEMRMINQYEKGLGVATTGNATSRRVTMVPTLRTDLLQGNSRYAQQHKTQLDFEDPTGQCSCLDRGQPHQQNQTSIFDGKLGGSVTHRGEQLYGGGGAVGENEYFGKEKK